MNKRKFIESCEPLRKRAEECGKEVNRLKSELREANRKFRTISESMTFLREIEEPRQDDPGKYHTAYFFVKEFDKRRVIASKEIALTKKCGTCTQSQPVVMKYTQTYDSPDGDEWTAEVYVLCPDHGLSLLDEIRKENRFLTF